MSHTLYDRDLQLWIEQTIRQLKNRELESLDIEHLIEELVDLGKSEKNALRSNLMILLAHLLNFYRANFTIKIIEWEFLIVLRKN